jgi:hypothetical protein
MKPSEQITSYVNELADWRGKMVERLRELIRDAAPGIVEGWKWNTPVWSGNKNVVAVGAFQDHVKLNFFQGAALKDPHGLFNAGLEAKATRAIDVYQGDVINEAALRELVRAAVALDSAKPQPNAGKSRSKRP